MAHGLQIGPAVNWGTAQIALLACTLFVACDRQPRLGPPKEPPPPPTSEDSIHVGPLSGKIDGQPFQVKSARYYVDARPGFERVEIKLYASASPTPCGALESPKSPSVWLRRVGRDKLEREKSTTTVKDGGKWEVHYQVQDDGFWIGVGEANALLVLDEPGPDLRLKGVMSACFRDHTGSCVAGEFSASFCRIAIDEPVRGTEAMERPPKRPLAAVASAPLPGSSAFPAPSASASTVSNKESKP